MRAWNRFHCAAFRALSRRPASHRLEASFSSIVTIFNASQSPATTYLTFKPSTPARHHLHLQSCSFASVRRIIHINIHHQFRPGKQRSEGENEACIRLDALSAVLSP